MFKKLKQKITEEQSPARGPAQASLRSTPVSAENRRRTSALSGQQDEDTATPDDRELLAGMIAEPAFLSEYTIFALESTKRPKPLGVNVNVLRSSEDNVSTTEFTDDFNGDGLAAPQKPEAQSFTQKLQLRVPSMESLFRTSAKELFRSPSKESLVRSASRESLNRIDTDVPGTGTNFDPSSDIESEAEDSNFESLSKDPSSHQFRRMERSLNNYRGKYSELVTAYRTLQRDKEKMQAVLSQAQDKSLRRIGELREELQMDQQAKKHIQEEFEAALEEKDQLIGVLQTQVLLLKHRVGPNVELPESQTTENNTIEPDQQSPSHGENSTDGSGEGATDLAKTTDVLEKRVKRQENLLQRCKEMIRTHKERCSQLTSEKDTLQEQLEERYQELEKIKNLHTVEKTKLITQLRDAKNLIEQLEQDKGMVIAETKRQMHETLELKEDEISQLRGRMQQLSGQRDDFLQQKEKSDKATFEELEKALAKAQKSEEKCKKLKEENKKRIEAIEQASEEERRNLQQELTRVKQEVVSIMKKSSEDRIGELEKLHVEAMISKEREYEQQLQTSQQEFQEQLKMALDKCHAEYRELLQDKEQQTALALEEQELQRKAIQAQADRQIQDVQGEMETFRTRVLELESSLLKKSQDGETQSEELGAEKTKHKLEIATLSEKHQDEIEKLRQEQEQLWSEKVQAIGHQYTVEIEELKAKHQAVEAQLKEKETQFQAHIEEMNQKTLEKLDVKQSELEALSTELNETMKTRHELEQQLVTTREDFETKLEQKQKYFEEEINVARNDHKHSLGDVEKALTEEINKLRLLLDQKENDAGEEIQRLKREVETMQNEAAAKLEVLRQDQQNEQKESEEKMNCVLDDQEKKYEAQIAELQSLLRNLETEKQNLSKSMEENELSSRTQLHDLTADLDASKSHVQELTQQLEEKNNELVQKINTQMEHETQITGLRSEIVQLQANSTEKERALDEVKAFQKQKEEDFLQKLTEDKTSGEQQVTALHAEYGKKVKSLEGKLDKFKQKGKEMHEKYKAKLSEQDVKLKEELEKKQQELEQKEQLFNEKILEMARASSTGISETVSQLESSQKEQLESLTEAHRHNIAEVAQSWEKKLGQKIEELQEKHEIELQEKEQEIKEIRQKLAVSNNEMEEMSGKITEISEKFIASVSKTQHLQKELKETSVHVDTLTQSESILKAKLQTFEEANSQILLEETNLRSQLTEWKKAEEQYNKRIHEVINILQETENKLQSVEALFAIERENYEKQLQEKHAEHQQQEAEFKNLLEKLMNCVQETDARMQLQSNEFCVKYDNKITALNGRLKDSQNQTEKVKTVLLERVNKFGGLDAQLKQTVEQNTLLNDSVQCLTQQLLDREEEIKTLKDELQSVATHQDTLQQESKLHTDVLSEKEACIAKFTKELAESADVQNSITEVLKEKESLAVSLEGQVNDLKLQLANSIGLAEKEEAISLLNQQNKLEQQRLLDQLDQLSTSIEAVTQEKISALEQANQFKTKLTELKKKAESKITQSNNKMKDLQEKLELSVKQNKEKVDQISSLTAEVEKLNTNLQSVKIEVEFVQREKEKMVNNLTTELQITNSRAAELDQEIAVKSEEGKVLEELREQLHQKEIMLEEMGQQLQQTHVGACDQANLYKHTEEQLQSLQAEISLKESEWEQKRTELENKKEEDLKDLQSRMKNENSMKIAELKKKAEQKIAVIKKQLTTQLEEKEHCLKRQDEQLQDLKQNAEEREVTMSALETKLNVLETTMGLEKEEKQKWVEKLKEEMELEKESSLKTLRESYEEQFMGLQKEVSARDDILQKYKEEMSASEQETKKTHSDLLVRLEKLEEENQCHKMDLDKLRSELEEQSQKNFILAEQQNEGSGNLDNVMGQLKVKTQQINEMEKTTVELQKLMEEKETTEKSLQIKILELESSSVLKEDIEKQLKSEINSLRECSEKQIKDLQAQLEEKVSLLNIFEENSEEKSKSSTELQKLLADLREQQTELRHKLEESENDKQKARKEYSKLQKDMRALRKEQEAEVSFVKKEINEECERKTKLDLEDMEMKHKSILKQLMREFNTQLAQKEQELETSVKDAIGKAQEVEAELMETHKEDINQLYRRISEKEDDLKRTAKTYEELLQSREEEMAAKVTEVQKQLGELQTQHQLLMFGEEIPSVEKGLLAQKTTLLNDARLKEQEFGEQIHSLEDQLRAYEKSSYMSPLATPFGDVSFNADGSMITEPTELEYLKKVLFEYMMGKETKTLAKVITTVLKFPADQTQKILEREDSRSTYASPHSGIF